MRAADSITALEPEVNSSTGFHVHVDASDFSLEDVKKISVAYILYEDAFDMLTKRTRQETNATIGRGLCRSNRREMVAKNGGSVQDQIRRIKEAATMMDVVRLVNPPTGVGSNPNEPKRIYKLNLCNLADAIHHNRGHNTI